MKIGNRKIGDDYPAFIIAEAGSNHDGKLEQAFKLVDVAVAAGADMVKFQIFKASKLYPPNCGVIDFGGKKLDLYAFFVKSEVSYDWLPKLKRYCDRRGIIFFATPFDEESADAMEKAGTQAYKIASSELNHIPLLRHVARKQKPMIMSEGLSTMRDIAEAVETVRGEGNEQIAVLHCVSDYPAPPEEYNLNVLQTIKRAFGVVVGLSDHTLDPVLVPTIAVASGARIIEKHFTLSKELNGADHIYALEPNELALMVKRIRETEKLPIKKKVVYLARHPAIMGGYEKIIAPCEKKIYPGDKRWIFSIKQIKKGEKFSKGNIAVLRAERFLKPGLHPRLFEEFLGAKCQKDIKPYQGLQWEHVLA